MSTCCKRGCCCCNKRDFSVLFGFILAAIAVAVPIVIHETNQEYGLVVIKFIRQYLSQADKHNGIPVEQTQSQTLQPGQNPYKLAIFQLLDDTENVLPQLGLVAFGLGCANAPLALLLICSALFRLPCGLGLWLTGSIIQMVVIGLPVFVYCFILIIYVALQMKMYVEASCAASILGLFYLMALIVWLTVLGCYHQMKEQESGLAYRRQDECDGYSRRSTQGHQRRSNGYQLRHFYPSHTGSSTSSRQLPPLPH
jgi:hypothetical protein